MITRLHDKVFIYEHLVKNQSLFAYHIGDLDPIFFSDCIWYGLIEQNALMEIVLIYHSLPTPTVLAFGLTPSMPQLVEAIRDKLPPRFFCHYSKELEPIFTSSYNVTPLGTHHKMDFHSFRVDFSLREVHECVQLTTRDASSLRELYQIVYPGNYFNPHMLASGKYYGIKQGEKILSVAGIHVYSRTYRIAVLGNITTHPLMRNQGLATQCIVTLLKTLEPDVDFIGLNVKADNFTAITLYQKIGFSLASGYEEALFEKC